MNYTKEYERSLKRRQYSSETIIHYLSDLKLFKQSANKQWRYITKSDVETFVKEQLNQKLSTKTINRRLWVIRGFYQYLDEELDYPVASPIRSFHFVRGERKLPPTLDNHEINKVLQIITDPRDRTIMILMLRCGLRVSEVAHLEMEKINLFRRQLRIMGKGAKEQVVPLPEEVIDLLVQCFKLRPQRNP